MRFQCPLCKDIVSSPDGQFGKRMICSHCNATVMTPESAFGSGMAVGDFIIFKKLGSGGAGVVYLAHQISLERPAALKILRDASPDTSDDPVQDLIREARSAGKLNHPNIVQAYAVGEDNGIFYFAMEYVDGETMKSVLKREGTIEAKRAAEIVKQIADALQFAWDKQKLTHRDIKPDNIMYTSNGQAKLADLGLSRRAGEHSDEDDSDEVMGTPQYISPEQLTGTPVDIRSDIYSLGATFYQFVTGRFPYEGPDVDDIAKQHVIGNLTPPREVNYNVPEEINRIIMKMMSRYPENRYHSPAELSKELDAFLHPAVVESGLSQGSRLRSAALGAAHGAAQSETPLSGGLRQGGMKVLAAPGQGGGSSLKSAFHRPDHSADSKEPLHTINAVPASLADIMPPNAAKKTLKLGAVNAAAAGSKAASTMQIKEKKSSSGTVMVIILLLLAVGIGFFMYSKQDGNNKKTTGSMVSKPEKTETVIPVDENSANGSETEFSKNEITAVLESPIPVTGSFEEQLTSKYMNFAYAACQAARDNNVDMLKLLVKAMEAERAWMGKYTALEQRTMNRVIDTCVSVLMVLSDGRRVQQALSGGSALIGMQFLYQGMLYEIESVVDGRFQVHLLRQSENREITLAEMSTAEFNKFIESVGARIEVKDALFGFMFYNLRFPELTLLRSSNLTKQQQMDFERMFFRVRLKTGGKEEEARLRQMYGFNYEPLQWAIRNPQP